MRSIFTRINLIITALLFSSLSVFSQEIEITGTVTDEYGSPIPGANIIVVGEKTGAQKIQSIGQTLTIFLANPDDPQFDLTL